MQKSEYDLQAEEFARKTGLQFSAVYLGHHPRLGEYSTSQWQIMLGRPGHKPYDFQFSQSINSSWKYNETCPSTIPKRGLPARLKQGLPARLKQEGWPKTGGTQQIAYFNITPVKTPPSLYDVLAALVKYDPGSHQDFCDNYGYDSDSIKGRDTYIAAQEEWSNVNRIFGDVLEELQEIN